MKVIPQTSAGVALTDVILAVFRVNGALLEAAEGMAQAGGLTAARWQVLGGVLDEPRSVAEVARRMGLTRQAVQRLANVLVDEGFASWETNPRHARAKLLAPTPKAYAAIERIAAVQHPWSNALGDALGVPELRAAATTLGRVVEMLPDHPPSV